mmetsp:Transcript_14683/g.44839  ORF Transcript_14683/g.44839 Transcript_14683/m.44839 type:complete len:126 (-) Transcript_14683:486-863(-)
MESQLSEFLPYRLGLESRRYGVKPITILVRYRRPSTTCSGSTFFVTRVCLHLPFIWACLLLRRGLHAIVASVEMRISFWSSNVDNVSSGAAAKIFHEQIVPWEGYPLAACTVGLQLLGITHSSSQ